MALAQAGDVAIIVYTSGTTGPSKGAMLTHRNIIFQVGAFKRIGLPLSETDEALNFLPLCHVAERFGGCYNHIAAMNMVNFAEAPDTVPQNLREVAPHMLLAVPRVWEKLYSAVTIRSRKARRSGAWPTGRRSASATRPAPTSCEGKPVPAAPAGCPRHCRPARAQEHPRRAGARPHALGSYRSGADLARSHQLVLGDGRARCMRSTGRPRTRGSPPRTGPDRQDRHHRPGCPGTELKLSPQGEILLRGPHIFEGYLNKPEKTAEALKDGWLHTGDVGVIDNQGFVRITDRMKDIIITAGGKNITPSEIENQLKFSPYISDAVVIGDKRSYLTCLIMIDHDNVVKFAQDKNVPFTNYASLCRAAEVQELIGREVEAVNKKFARVETVKKFRLIDQLLTAEDEELTPTMKLKRSLVERKYGQLIKGMYASAA